MAQQDAVQLWKTWNQTVWKGYELLPPAFLGTWLDEYVDCLERSTKLNMFEIKTQERNNQDVIYE